MITPNKHKFFKLVILLSLTDKSVLLAGDEVWQHSNTLTLIEKSVFEEYLVNANTFSKFKYKCKYKYLKKYLNTNTNTNVFDPKLGTNTHRYRQTQILMYLTPSLVLTHTDTDRHKY